MVYRRLFAIIRNRRGFSFDSGFQRTIYGIDKIGAVKPGMESSDAAAEKPF
jgi:hypothetical protein